MNDCTDRSQFRIGDLLVMPDRLIVMHNGQEIPLQPRMMAVLILLAKETGKILSPQRLLVTIWRTDVYGNNSVQKRFEVFGNRSATHRAIHVTSRLCQDLAIG